MSRRTANSLDDWDVFIARWREVARPLKRMKPIRNGVNIITPEILGTFRSVSGDPVEVSTGTGMGRERIYGLTYREGDERSRCVLSLDEVLLELEGGGQP